MSITKPTLTFASATKPLALTAAAVLGASALIAAPASADGGSVVKPTPEQKTAVIKAWSQANGGGWTGPDGCLFVRLSKSDKNVAGLRSNVAKKPNKCAPYAFDGAALFYGHKQSKWFPLAEGSAIAPAQCKATKHLLGIDVWVDLVDFAAILGCENID